MNRVIEYYRGLFKNNRAWINKSVTLFLVMAGVGFLAFFRNPDLIKSIVSIFADRFGTAPALDTHLALQIFEQNVLASGVALFGGLILGIGSILVVGVNGFFLGYIAATVLFMNDNLGQSVALIAGGILPHGILEIPAFLLAASFGLRLGWEWLGKGAKGEIGERGSRLKVLKNNFIQALAVAPLIVIVLFIAALIEVFVSGKLIGNM